MTILLVGRSRKGKNRVREHGSEWVVVERRPSVACFDGAAGVRIRSVRTGATRWIKAENDPDFDSAR